MSQTHLQRVMDIFHEVGAMTDAEREDRLESLCLGDEGLRAEVLDLLYWDRISEDPLSLAVSDIAADLHSGPEGRVEETIGPYRVIREIGQGGMGRVFLADRADEAFKRSVAIKVIRGWADSEIVNRFKLERGILASLDHPNIASLLDGGTTGSGLPYLVMEYIEGEPIGEYCDRVRLGVNGRIRLVQDLCHAVHYAHERSVVHRDLKPSNILVTPNGVPKLLDFGIAKLLDDGKGQDTKGLTLPSQRLMTPEYASPEQLAGDAATTASDVYMLGLILYELLTGSKAHHFEGQRLDEIVKTVTTKPVIKPSVVIQRHRSDRHNLSGDSSGTDRYTTRASTAERLQRILKGDLDNIALKALSKEPSQRYSSAFEMAEDLDRFLKGDPVTACPPRLTYILGKRLKKDWRTVAVAGLVIVSLLILTGLWLNSRAGAAAQAASAQQFAREIERISGDLRLEYLLPLHDITPAKNRVRESILKIQEQMEEIGSAATGPGTYAVGVGHLVLGEYETARKWLTEAWDSGFQTPEVATNLGLALGRLYESAVLEVNGISDHRVREQRLGKLRTELRDPAIRLLGQNQPDGEIALYTQGLINFYEGEMEVAQEKAQAASSLRQWFYEARLLEGDIHLESAQKASLSGDLENARVDLSRAQSIYKEAAELAPSSPDVYERLCNAGVIAMTIEMEAGKDLNELLANSTKACTDASLTDSERPLPYVDLAQMYSVLGTYRRRHGEDPLPSLKTAAENARRAISLDPTQTRPYIQLGTALQQYGAHEFERGLDPRGSFEAAIKAYSEAEALGLSNANLFNSLANTISYRGEWEWLNRYDSRASMEEAVAAYEKAIQADPDHPLPYGNLGITYKDIGIQMLNRGEDPLPVFEKSIENYEASLARNPNHAGNLNNIAHTWYQIGWERMRHGENPEEALKEAERHLSKATEINPNYASPFVNRGQVEYLRAQVALAEDRDPRPILNRARNALNRAIEINPGHRSQYYAHLGRVELLEARWGLEQDQEIQPFLQAACDQAALIRQTNAQDEDQWAVLAEAKLLEGWNRKRQGASPVLSFNEALDAITEALKMNPDATYLAAIGAEIYLGIAQWPGNSLQNRQDAIESGYNLAQKAKETNSRRSRLTPLQGALLTVQAELDRDPATRTEAIEILSEALYENRYFSHEFAPYLNRARAIELP